MLKSANETGQVSVEASPDESSLGRSVKTDQEQPDGSGKLFSVHKVRPGKSFIPTLGALRKAASLSINSSSMKVTEVSGAGSSGWPPASKSKSKSRSQSVAVARTRRGLARSFSMLAMRYSSRLAGSSEHSLVGAGKQIGRITHHFFNSTSKSSMSRQRSEFNIDQLNNGERKKVVGKRASSMLCLSSNQEQERDKEDDVEEQPVEQELNIDDDQENFQIGLDLNVSKVNVIKKSRIGLNGETAVGVEEAEEAEDEAGQREITTQMKRKEKGAKRKRSDRLHTLSPSGSSSQTVSSKQAIKESRECKQEASKASSTKTNLAKFNKNHISAKQNGAISTNKSSPISNKLSAEKQQANQEPPAKGFWHLR